MLIHVNISILIPVCEWLAKKPVHPSKNVVYQFFTMKLLLQVYAHYCEILLILSSSTYYKYVIIIRIL